MWDWESDEGKRWRVVRKGSEGTEGREGQLDKEALIRVICNGSWLPYDIQKASWRTEDKGIWWDTSERGIKKPKEMEGRKNNTDKDALTYVIWKLTAMWNSLRVTGKRRQRDMMRRNWERGKKKPKEMEREKSNIDKVALCYVIFKLTAIWDSVSWGRDDKRTWWDTTTEREGGTKESENEEQREGQLDKEALPHVASKLTATWDPEGDVGMKRRGRKRKGIVWEEKRGRRAVR